MHGFLDGKTKKIGDISGFRKSRKRNRKTGSIWPDPRTGSVKLSAVIEF
jgi:hypothetical protein